MYTNILQRSKLSLILLAAFLAASACRANEQHARIPELLSAAIVGIDSDHTSGSGVVISPDGLILTATTALRAGSDSVGVSFADGTKVGAKVLARDSKTEIVLLKLHTDHALAFVELADSSKTCVGESAWTAGNPFKVLSSDRQVGWSAGTITGIYSIENVSALETDAGVNPGSDGGALLDTNGHLLGILTLRYAPSRQLGTAVPIHLIKQSFAENLKSVPVCGRCEHDCATESAAEAIARQMHLSSIPAARAAVALRTAASGGMGSWQSGFVIDPSGYVLTAGLPVRDTAEVLLADGRSYSAVPVAQNAQLDIALLKICVPLRNGQIGPQIFSAVALCDNHARRPGEYVAVLGLGEQCTLTQSVGIVSALDRLDGNAIQTDARINPENAGGGVLDLNGRLIGIAQHFRPDADWSLPNSGVGFFTDSCKIASWLKEVHVPICTHEGEAVTGNERAFAAQRRLIDIVQRASAAIVFIGDGSGVTVSSDGYILTNYHIAGNSQVFTVRLAANNQHVVCDVIGSDRSGDLVLLKARNCAGLPYVEFGNLAGVAAGEPVIAIGDPYKLAGDNGDPAVSIGIISAMHRFHGRYADAIQSDSAINPGCSGGPLLTLDGKLAGINGQIVSRFSEMANSRIAYTIPTDQIQRLYPILKEARGGLIVHADLPPGLNFERSAAYSAYGPVAAVQTGSPAQKCGLCSGDQILSIDGKSVCDCAHLVGIIRSYPRQAYLDVQVERNFTSASVRLSLSGK